MLQRDFCSFGEICHEVGGEEAIRQALLRGALPAYLELRALRARYEVTNGKYPAHRRFPRSGSNLDCSWKNIGPPKAKEGEYIHMQYINLDEYTLDGWFRLSQASLQHVARHNSFNAFPRVMPPAEFDPIGEMDDVLELSYYAHPKKGPLRYQLESDFRLATASRSDLWFRPIDLELLKDPTKPSQVATDKLPGTPKLRSDREQNLLRVIAGLWALSGLPLEHNVTADKLSALFDGWKWDKPAKQTIADSILKEAANLPGAVIRKSDG